MQLRVQHLAICSPDRQEPILVIEAFALTPQAQIAVLGASGAGKSTFLHAISGLLPLQKGQVQWEDQDLADLSAGAKDNWRFQNIGMIMQNFYLTMGLSALENVLLPYRFRHWRLPATIKTRAADLLARMNFPHIHRCCEKLSRGEMQRAAIARALLGKPRIIIADEPTASLDQDNAQIIAALLPQIAAQEQCSLIVSTHEQRLAAALPQSLILNKGRIVQETN